MRTDRVLAAYREFFAGTPRTLDLVGHFRDVAASVPAYRAFLAEAGVDPAAVHTAEDFRRLPMMTKQTYHQRYPLPERCRDGRLDGCDIGPCPPARRAARPSGPVRSPTNCTSPTGSNRSSVTFGADARGDPRGGLLRPGYLGRRHVHEPHACRHLAAKGYPDHDRRRRATTRTRSCASSRELGAALRSGRAARLPAVRQGRDRHRPTRRRCRLVARTG